MEALRPEVKEEHSEVSGLKMTSAHLGIDTFKLLLLPFWIAHVGHGDASRLVFVNGQSGSVGQNARPPGLLSWVTGFLRGNA